MPRSGNIKCGIKAVIACSRLSEPKKFNPDSLDIIDSIMVEMNLRQSDHIVVIADDFKSLISNDFQVPEEKISVIPNWAPLDNLPVLSKTNPWSIAHGLDDSEQGRAIFIGRRGGDLFRGCQVLESNLALPIRERIGANARSVENGKAASVFHHSRGSCLLSGERATW